MKQKLAKTAEDGSSDGASFVIVGELDPTGFGVQSGQPWRWQGKLHAVAAPRRAVRSPELRKNPTNLGEKGRTKLVGVARRVEASL